VRQQWDRRSIPATGHDIVSAVTDGYHHKQCRGTLARYTSHLVVEALSGYKNGKVCQREKLKRVYGRALYFHECGGHS